MLFAKSTIPVVAGVALYVGAALTVAGPALANGHFVYTNDQYYNGDSPANTVTAFSVERNGQLTLLNHFPTDDFACNEPFYSSRSVAISRNGDFLFAANNCGTSVSVFLGASTGELVLLKDAAIKAETSPSGVSIAPDGKCVVLGFDSGDVSSFRFPELRTPVHTRNVGSAIADMKIGRPGRGHTEDDGEVGEPGADRHHYVAATLPSANEVAVIPLSPSTCALGVPRSIPTSTNSAQVPEAPTGLDFSPKNDILYVSDANNLGRTKVEVFAFPAGKPVKGSPFVYYPPQSGANSSTVLVSKDGQCLFVANQDSAGLTSIPLSRGIPGSTAIFFPISSPGTTIPAGLANDITGKMFYVAGGPFFSSSSSPPVGGNTVTTEIIGNACALTPLPPVGTGVPVISPANFGILNSLTAFP